MRKIFCIVMIGFGLCATSVAGAVDFKAPSPGDLKDPCKMFPTKPGCEKTLPNLKPKIPANDFMKLPPQSDTTPCADGIAKGLHKNSTCCVEGESTILLPEEKLYACAVIPKAEPPVGATDEPAKTDEPADTETTGPKCSANQYLFGGVLCCDPEIETPNIITMECIPKDYEIVADPAVPLDAATTDAEDNVEDTDDAGANSESNCSLHPRPGTPALSSSWLVWAFGCLAFGLARRWAKTGGPA